MTNRKDVFKVVLVVCAVVGFLVLCNPLPSWSQGPMHAKAPSDIWKPRQVPAGTRFANQNSCAECHADKTTSYQHHAMAKALETVAESQILRAHPRLTFRNGPFSYQVVRQGEQSIYTVTDGVNTISEPILYSFGQGRAGQTYVLQHKGQYYESRLSFYNDTQSLDVTLGYPPTAPASLDEALGRAISPEETKNCFSCHATAAVSGSQLQLDKMMPGVSCQACHGPGEQHIGAMKAGNFKQKYIYNPGTLSADDLSQEFCASCHRGVEDVIALSNSGGINNVRHQPYRIFNSKCYGDDHRISCTACHDPHEPLKVNSAVFYDAKCNACHLPSPKIKLAKNVQVAKDRTAPFCPVGTQNCASCHMPKIDLPGAHFKFTDHRIRVVKPGAPFPTE